MARDLGAELDTLPEARRRKVHDRADEIEREIAPLNELCRLAAKSEAEAAAAEFGTSQPAVSRLEQGADMFLSTLRGYEASLGGKLDLVVRLPGRPEVRRHELGDLHAAEDAPTAGRRAPVRTRC
jgi:hypothetical protein